MVKRHIKDIRDYFLIRNSGIFDPIFYLVNYDDVRIADIDPLWHYIRFGWKEGRNPSVAFDTQNYSLLEFGKRIAPVNPLVHFLHKDKHRVFESPILFDNEEDTLKDLVFSPEELVRSFSLERMREYLLNHKDSDFIVSLSHDDYTKSVGGVQLYILNEQVHQTNLGINYIHIYPTNYSVKDSGQTDIFTYGVNINGTGFGVGSFEEIFQNLEEIKQSIKSIVIHHTQGFTTSQLQKICTLTKKKMAFWIHDFHSICSSNHLLRNDRNYCAAPLPSSDSCRVCKYGLNRLDHILAYRGFFKKHKPIVYAPSTYIAEKWKELSEFDHTKLIVSPLLELKRSGQRERINWPIRIGYPGYPRAEKGWDLWLKLVELFEMDDRYQFFQFSFVKGIESNYEVINTRSTKNNPYAMRNNLERYSIDFILIWPLMPESYSLVMYEAIGAGVYVLTNSRSGNVAATISDHPEWGRVFSTKEELINSFQTGEFIVDLMKKSSSHRNTYNLNYKFVDYL